METVINSSAEADKHIFSITLNSVEHVKTLNLPHEREGGVLIEGFLGTIHSIQLIERVMLEIKGSNGILRMDITENELRELTKNKSFIPLKE